MNSSLKGLISQLNENFNIQHLEEELDELEEDPLAEDNSGNSGGEYMTPNAFRKTEKEIDDVSYSEDVPDTNRFYKRIEETINRIDEANYKDYRNDDTKSERQKINGNIIEINRKLREVEQMISHASKLKLETGQGSDIYWKQTGNSFFLHNNEIAKMENGSLWITNAGWNSRTTYERLNGLPGVSVNTKQGKTYLNGVPWDGNWINVGKSNALESRLAKKPSLKVEARNIIRRIIKEEVKRALTKKGSIRESYSYKPTSARGMYLEIKPASNGNLILKLTEEGKEELEDIYADKKLSDLGQLEMHIYDIFDDIQGNSEYRFSSDLGEDGFGMTSAPGIIMGNMSDDGNGYEDDSICWYDPNYQIRSFVEDLMNKGSFEFKKAD